MPQFLIRLLPYGAAALALIGAVAFIDHRGYQRAEEKAALAKANDAIIARDLQRTITAALSLSVAQVDANTAATVDGIQVTNRTIIQPRIREEIQREIRFSNPDLGLSDGLLAAINAARRLSSDTTPARELEIDLPAVEPANRQDDSDAGD